MEPNIIIPELSGYYNILFNKLDRTSIQKIVEKFPQKNNTWEKRGHKEVINLFLEFFIIYLTQKNLFSISFPDNKAIESLVTIWKNNLSTLPNKLTKVNNISEAQISEIKLIFSLLHNSEYFPSLEYLDNYLTEAIYDAKDTYGTYAFEEKIPKCSHLIISSVSQGNFDAFLDMNLSIEE